MEKGKFGRCLVGCFGRLFHFQYVVPHGFDPAVGARHLNGAATVQDAVIDSLLGYGARAQQVLFGQVGGDDHGQTCPVAAVHDTEDHIIDVLVVRL